MPTIRDLIRAKRDGAQHSADELAWLVEEAVAGNIPDYQLSAWLMAVCFLHLSDDEAIALTDAFVASGETLNWSGSARPIVDKHSTGGVGDKVTLALAPMLAAAGLGVCKMSGRGLGHTGGTIDKLASIPGFRTDLAEADVRRIVDECGCCVAQQSPRLVPADKLFYELRDATETVDELGLITASVMSKKLAFGASCIVLDVKCGSGAFFMQHSEAGAFVELARVIAERAGRKLAAVISPMDQPLGRCVGNAMEVMEAAQMLSGERDSPELRAACVELGEAALSLVGSAHGRTAPPMGGAYEDGSAWHSFQTWISAQGGDWDRFLRDFAAAQSRYQRVAVKAPHSGTVTRLDARAIGELACDLGAGRRAKDDQIDPWVGIELLAKTGDAVSSGAEIALLVLQPQTDAEAARDQYARAITIE